MNGQNFINNLFVNKFKNKTMHLKLKSKQIIVILKINFERKIAYLKYKIKFKNIFKKSKYSR